MTELFKGPLLLFVMLNPFLLSVYLRDLIEDLDRRTFFRVMARGGTIGAAVFVIFAAGGDRIFRDVLSVRFASFQIFGGIVFALIGLRYVFRGQDALRDLRGDPKQIAGSVAMPVLIGPGSVSASVMIGARVSLTAAVVSIIATVALAVLSVALLKWLFDVLKARHEELVARYMDVVGRISALVIGTLAVELVLLGLESWQDHG